MNVDYFIKYFDLDSNYTDIKKQLLLFDDMDICISYGSGIRILNQDPLEMIISFIISANNNIPRIRTIIERLCNSLGECIEADCYAFPTLTALSLQPLSFYKSIGLGYRAEYIVKTVTMLLNGFDIDNLYQMSTVEARKTLMTLCGVGPKVADCILLFGYHKQDVFPVDIWVKRIYNDIISKNPTSPVNMSRELVAKFSNLSGYAQQYLFYYYRETYTKLEEIL